MTLKAEGTDSWHNKRRKVDIHEKKCIEFVFCLPETLPIASDIMYYTNIC
jgi:hypothetical protein